MDPIAAVNRNRLSRNSSSSFRLRSPSLNSLRLHRIFDLFDKNADGIITVDEIYQALALLGLDTDLPDLESAVNPYIDPHTGGLRFDDFAALHRSLNDAFFGGGEAGDGGQEAAALQEESDMREAFKVFDEDGDGYISSKELQAVLTKLGLAEEAMEMDRVEKMIHSVDQNNDGRVDFFEFKNMMNSVTVRSS